MRSNGNGDDDGVRRNRGRTTGVHDGGDGGGPVQRNPAPGKMTLEDVESAGTSRSAGAAPPSEAPTGLEDAKPVTGGAWEADAGLQSAMGLGDDHGTLPGAGSTAVPQVAAATSSAEGAPVQRLATGGGSEPATGGAWEFSPGLASAMGLGDDYGPSAGIDGSVDRGVSVQRRAAGAGAAPVGGAPASTDRPPEESMLETRATIDDSPDAVADRRSAAAEDESGDAGERAALDPQRAPASIDRAAGESMMETRATIDDSTEAQGGQSVAASEGTAGDAARGSAPDPRRASASIDRPAEESMVENRATIDDRSGGDAAAEPGWVARARAYHREHAAEVQRFNALTANECADGDSVDPYRVARWQEAHGVPPDGRIGGATVRAARRAGGGAAATVQRKAASAASAEPDVHATAAAGISGPGSALPHLDTIQRSFGAAHDVSQVQAHVGGDAAEATTAIGAEAYATGNHVAFAGTPSLHTAAHEAAHVVQQRRGVHLKGGVGEAGDAYEQHADAVADRVVQGKSAADLIEQVAGPQGAASSRDAPVQMSPQGDKQQTRSIAANLVGHASPRWERTHGKDRRVLNLNLSRERVDAVRALFIAMLDSELVEKGFQPQMAVNFSTRDDDGAVEVHDDAAGDRETTTEAQGDHRANKANMRRVDIGVTIIKRTRGNAEASSTRSSTVPGYCEPDATREWAVKMELSGGAGHAGVGAAGALAWLKNRMTGQEVHCKFVGGGGGVGASTPGADIFSNYTDFTTDQEYSFKDFDGAAARLTQLGGGIGIIGYGFTYLSFPTLGANSIDLGGPNMGQLGADASTNAGVWWLDDVPQPVCHPERRVVEDVVEQHEYQYDEQQELDHVVRFETQSAIVSETEQALLDSFVKTLVTSHE